MEQKEEIIRNVEKPDMCYLTLAILSGKQNLDMKQETHGPIELEPKEGLDIFDYSNLALSALCGIDLDLESVVVW